MLHPAALGPSDADDARLAEALAAGAGEVLLELRSRVDRDGLHGHALRAAGDAAAQAYLAGRLATERPGDAVLSEEAPDGPQRLSAARVWIIDPLDGTREFAERRSDGRWRDDFAVHVALWRRGRGLTAAAVGLPARGLVYGTGGSADAALEWRSRAGERPEARPLRVAVSRSRPPVVLGGLPDDVIVLVPMGSSGAKAMAVLEGTVDAYVHAGGQHEWDSAAPVAVARAAGLLASRLDGSALEYNKAEPSSPDLVICQPWCARRLRGLFASAGMTVGAAARGDRA